MLCHVPVGRSFCRLFALAALVAVAACDGQRPDEVDAVVTLAIATTPPDVACVQATVTSGTRRVVRSVDASPGQPLAAKLMGLPTGSVQVLLEGFSAACAGVTVASEPTWLSDPLPLMLSRGVPVPVKVVMRESGRINLEVDFVSDNGMGTCATDSECSAGTRCIAGACVDTRPNGATCTGNNSCASKFCVDGVCCNSACQGPCLTCSAAASPGTCGAAPAGKVCGAPLCSGQTTSQSFCDGSGMCAPSMPVSCAPYVCSGMGCKTSCATDTDCVAGHFCAAGRCQARLANGAACTAGFQCASSSCFNGTCS